MFQKSLLENVLFLDMETAPIVQNYAQLPERLKPHWDRKTELLQKNVDEKMAPPEYFGERAAIYAEFGKPVCVTIGSVTFGAEGPAMKLKSFFGPDEVQILKQLTAALTQFDQKRRTAGKDPWLAAHNGKEFDFPFLCRRYLIHGLPLPPMLADLHGKKPWEVKVLDTMELWKFGDFKSFTSLDLLTAVLGIPSPKGDMDGSDVARVFWQDKDYARIARYCTQDVVATAQVLLKLSGQPLITEPQIHILD